MKTTLTAFLMLSTVAFLAGCGISPQAILGEWESTAIYDYSGGTLPTSFAGTPVVITSRTEQCTFDATNIFWVRIYENEPPISDYYPYYLKKDALYVTEPEFGEYKILISFPHGTEMLIMDNRPFWVMHLKKLSEARNGTNNVFVHRK